MSGVTCHLSCVRCHMSCVTCHVSHVTCNIFFYFFFTKWWSLSVEGLLSTGPTPSSFYRRRKIYTGHYWSFRTPWCDGVMTYDFTTEIDQSWLAAQKRPQTQDWSDWSWVHRIMCRPRGSLLANILSQSWHFNVPVPNKGFISGKGSSLSHFGSEGEEYHMGSPVGKRPSPC